MSGFRWLVRPLGSGNQGSAGLPTDLIGSTDHREQCEGEAMNDLHTVVRRGLRFGLPALMAVAVILTGCGPQLLDARTEVLGDGLQCLEPGRSEVRHARDDLQRELGFERAQHLR